MKRNLLSAVLILFSLCAPQFVLGQGMSPAGSSAGKQEMMAKLEKMSSELQLTPDQKKQMLPVLMDEAPKMKAVKADTTLGPLQKAMKMKEIGSDTDAKVKPILNADQWQKWEAMRAQEREQMMQKMKGN